MTVEDRLSCSEFSFPALDLEDRLQLLRLLGFASVDLGLFLNSASEVRAFLDDPRARTARLARGLEAADLSLADLFLIVGGNDFEVGALTNPSAQQRDILRSIFIAALGCARDLEAQGVSILPGLAWPDDPGAGWRVAVEELTWRVDRAERAGIELRIEPHVGSNVATPELAAQLVADVPGLKLTLDPGHFVFQVISVDRILNLARVTGHVHLSGATAGALHVPLKRSSLDIRAIVSGLEAAGFCGTYCIEYVPMDKWGADSTDVLSAVVETRDLVARLVQELVGAPA